MRGVGCRLASFWNKNLFNNTSQCLIKSRIYENCICFSISCYYHVKDTKILFFYWSKFNFNLHIFLSPTGFSQISLRICKILEKETCLWNLEPVGNLKQKGRNQLTNFKDKILISQHCILFFSGLPESSRAEQKSQ